MPSFGSTAAAPVLPAATSLGAVALTVSDLQRARTFYERVLGLRARELSGESVALADADGPTLVTLHGDPHAPARDARAPGLFHLAILLPSRPELARALRRIVAVRWPLAGASDHLVSEALYLSDPDGNGIELYRDRPRDAWPRDPTGTLRMATRSLDLRDLAAEAGGADPDDRGTARMGHVHLQVSDIPPAEAFYHGVLGFDVTIRTYPGALFLSAGGYHHHVGLNTWNSAGVDPGAPGSVGLRCFEVTVPDAGALAGVRERAQAAGREVSPTSGDGALVVHDPSDIAVRVRRAQ